MRALRLSLLLAVAGALVILLRLFGDVASFAGVAAIIVGVVLSAPYAPPPEAPGRGWWTMLATGAGITILAAVVSLVTETVGGLLAALGCVLVAVAVALAFPLPERGSPGTR
jgi:hypothetical protein